MTYEQMIFSLVGFTLIAAIAWALYEKVRTKRSQERSGDPDGHKATDDALHAHKTDTSKPI